ncbi:hypothetical protein Prudu_019405 [Prunus dulcis]|uniref:Uncharacterized protein n=1 Tax=Prunus dulcis TaxID=3755 RepID=A0A4Y1RSZ3_PRUDU|nr:hypothetical protein Prudu_019405 [Prunus dulcis]
MGVTRVMRQLIKHIIIISHMIRSTCVNYPSIEAHTWHGIRSTQICRRGRRTGRILSHSAGGLGTVHKSFVVSKPIGEDRQEG